MSTPPKCSAPVASEHAEQTALIAWARVGAAYHPELGMLFAIPNGGHRDIRVARKLKAEGVVAGVPDLFLAVARQPWHGLFIELKRASGGRVSAAQRDMHARLRGRGYQVQVCDGWDEARVVLATYLGCDDLANGAA